MTRSGNFGEGGGNLKAPRLPYHPFISQITQGYPSLFAHSNILTKGLLIDSWNEAAVVKAKKNFCGVRYHQF